jgi:rubrerythrin
MTETIKNLTKAFVGESMARNRYIMYAKVAKKEGYERISELFTLTADQEREHAKWLFRLIQGLKQNNEEIAVDASAPTILGNTIENLKAAIAGENHEHESMYPEFANVAEEEGHSEIAVRLRSIAKAEANHEYRYKLALEELENKTVFEKDEPVTWVCRKCGYVHEGSKAPAKCPSCDHPTAYFEVQK